MAANLILVFDVVAIAILVLGLYFPRHRRKDLVAAYIGVNVGVVAVASALSSGAVGAGLGLGLFGVLSIIRLRSAELDQEEVAYFFASLALGLLGGLGIDNVAFGGALMVAIILALYIGDHPKLFAGYRSQVINLDTAISNEAELACHLERLLDAQVHRLKVRKLDLVNDSTLVEVRYRVNAKSSIGGDCVTNDELARQ